MSDGNAFLFSVFLLTKFALQRRILALVLIKGPNSFILWLSHTFSSPFDVICCLHLYSVCDYKYDMFERTWSCKLPCSSIPALLIDYHLEDIKVDGVESAAVLLNGSDFLKRLLALSGNSLRFVSYHLWLLHEVSGEAGDLFQQSQRLSRNFGLVSGRQNGVATGRAGRGWILVGRLSYNGGGVPRTIFKIRQQNPAFCWHLKLKILFVIWRSDGIISCLQSLTPTAINVVRTFLDYREAIANYYI